MCHKENAFIVAQLNKEVDDWVKENLQDIVRESQKVANSLGISRQDVVVAVDLKASSCPTLLIKPIKDYIEGSAMPDWGCQIDMEHFIQRLNYLHSGMTDRHILVLHRTDDAECELCRLEIRDSLHVMHVIT
jgi:hypothetical protein